MPATATHATSPAQEPTRNQILTLAALLTATVLTAGIAVAGVARAPAPAPAPAPVTIVQAPQTIPQPLAPREPGD